MTNLSISIAMCTYNGAAFVREQLDSFTRQTRLPKELIVCDDRSTDNTVEIVRAFAQSAPFPVHVVVNDENLGVARNFGKAIGMCTGTGREVASGHDSHGDIIALSDQDDIWREDKLAVIAEVFDNSPNLSLVFTDADLVDQNLTPMGKRLSDTGHIDATLRSQLGSDAAFELLLRRNVATGATIAFRRSLTDLILPIPDKLLTYHDAWIVALAAAGCVSSTDGAAAATGSIAFLPEPLIRYRQHAGQHTWDFVYVHGAKRVLNRAYYESHLNQLVEMRNRLSTAGKLTSTAPAIVHLDGYIEHLRRRSTLPAGRLPRIAPILSELLTGRYSRYSSGLRSAARDLIAGTE